MLPRLLFLPVLMLAVLGFSGCQMVQKKEVTIRKNHPLKFQKTDEDFKEKVLRIIPSEKIELSSSVTQSSGEEDVHFLIIKIINPEIFPDYQAFMSQSETVKKQVENSVENLEEYDRLYVLVEQQYRDKDVERTRSEKREFTL